MFLRRCSDDSIVGVSIISGIPGGLIPMIIS
jgi:hypothetical protein